MRCQAGTHALDKDDIKATLDDMILEQFSNRGDPVPPGKCNKTNLNQCHLFLAKLTDQHDTYVPKPKVRDPAARAIY